MSATIEVLVEREKALFSTWYELFPRSTFVAGPAAPGRAPTTAADEELVHGTLAGVVDELDHVAAMGFDVLYLPPIHPIGTSFRKGPDNAEVAGPDDVGSPWAIGSAAGGHTAVHPELGTRRRPAASWSTPPRSGASRWPSTSPSSARRTTPGSPSTRSGSRTAPTGASSTPRTRPSATRTSTRSTSPAPAWRDLWEALLGVAEFWMDQGVRVFRVDNPHTKPFAFWEWFIAQLRRRDPGVILLSEAFTRPEVMAQLTRCGFTQSYSYFTWRVSKAELTDYALEVATGPGADGFRANFWPNTPDILPWHLHGARREMFALRHLLAATLSASYGVYGPAFELGENTSAGNGKEEYAASEKYELRRWHLDRPDSLRDQMTRVNRIRHEQLALHTNRTLRFHEVPNDRWSPTPRPPTTGPTPIRPGAGATRCSPS